MALKNLDDLFLHTLKDILYAEKQILKALPKMEKKASSAELKKAFAQHREETEGQLERLEQVFDSIGQRTRGACGASCRSGIVLAPPSTAPTAMPACSSPSILAGLRAAVRIIRVLPR